MIRAAIRYRINAPLGADDLRAIYTSSGLIRPIGDRRRLARMAKEADVTVTAWDGTRLVGIARAITDFAYCAYLSDLGVDEAYQRKGIGREMVRRMRARLGDRVMLLLLANVNARDYYGKIGFERADNAWKVPRKR